MTPSPEATHTPAPSGHWRKSLCALLFVAYFFLVSWDTLKAQFSPDEMMNIWSYWSPSPWRLLESQFMIWRGSFRPAGGLFYLPLYQVFGLTPVAYHAALLVLLLVGAYQMYRLSRALGTGEVASAMVALIACYHGGLSNLYYNSVFVFDVLCGIFFFATLAYYVRIRSSGRILSGGQTAAFLALYLCTLNSKEMGATLPAVLLAYEWLFHGPPGFAWKRFAAWLRGEGRGVFWAGLLDAVFIYGKRFGADGLMKQAAYRPVISRERFLDFQARYIGDIFYHLPRFGWSATLIIWAAVTYLAWRRKNRLLRFCWWYIVLTPLPLAFLDGRDQACLYVTLAGWAVLAGTLFESWLPALARVVAAEALFRRMEFGHVRTLVAAAVMMAMALTSWSYKKNEVEPGNLTIAPLTTEVLAQFRAVNPQVPPGSNVIFLTDPFHSYDMAFIAQLWFGDRATRVRLNRETPLSDGEIAAADAVFTWQEGKLIRVR
ncbi:MAG: hypothetical protein ABSB88_07790 [Bryobacteraceae bacterium]